MKNKHILLCILFNISLLNIILAQTPQVNRAELVPDFSSSAQEITLGDCISFTDLSTGSPIFWQWTFPGAETPSSNYKNPKDICYYKEGTYDVILEIQNENNTVSKHTVGYIKVLPNTTSPVANFEANIKTVSLGSSVDFTDLSINGPFEEYDWEFSGGTPSSSNLATPPPVVYSQVGTYNVKLKVKTETGAMSIKHKTNYIKVVPVTEKAPEPNFISDRTFIAPGEFVNFKDLSTGHPNSWEWEFEGAASPTSNLENPSGIQYLTEGSYKVKLKVKNEIGEKEITKEKYIIVNTTDPCTTAPVANFSSSNRIISTGSKVYFEDLSENSPTSWKWVFEGGYPTNYTTANITNGIEYNANGYFNVSLTVSNECGSNTITKEKYIIVLSNPTDKFCDTISNIEKTENIHSPSVSPWGKIGGHNSQKTRIYAEKYDKNDFSYIDGIMFPVVKAKKAKPNSFVSFIIWDGNSEFPDDAKIIKQEKVLLKNINENFINSITFDKPVEVNGPFFLGYKINYVDINNDGISDDDFAISIAENRIGENAKNTLLVKTGGKWQTCFEKFGIKTSSAMRVSACIFDENSIEEIKIEDDINVVVYPNPASSEVRIKINGNDKDGRTIIRLLDISGRIIFNEEFSPENDHFTINTKHLNSGLYFVDIVTNSNRVTKKVMISK